MLGLQSLAGVSQGPGSRVRFKPKSFSESSSLQGKSLCGVHGSPRRPQVFIIVFLLLRGCTAEEIKEFSKKRRRGHRGVTQFQLRAALIGVFISGGILC